MGQDRLENAVPIDGRTLLILHCLWCLGNDQTGKFFLWAESSLEHEKAGRGSRNLPPRHPHQASSEDMLDALGLMVPGQVRGEPNIEALSLAIPTVKGEPIASSPLISETRGVVSTNDPAQLRLWTVEGIQFSVEDAVPLLTSIGDVGGASGDQNGETYLLGSDLLFWSKATKFLLDLLVRQRFIPHVKKAIRRGQASYRTAWTPLIIEKEDIERLRLLAESMPPACKAAHERDPQRLIESFLSEATDAMIRRWISAGNRYERPSGGESVGTKWFLSLISTDRSLVAGSHEKLEGLRDGLQLWISEISSAEPRLRCCFRLEPPSSLEVWERKDVIVRQKDSPWVLSYFLHASDDPSLLLPAEEVWRGRVPAGFDTAELEAALLTALGKASRLCKKINESLMLSPTPTHARLNVNEAYFFLANDAWLLRESGFGVLIPSWSATGRGSRIQLQLRAKPSQQQQEGKGLGIFTLRSIVEFDWKVAIGDGSIILTEEEFIKLVSLKQPLVSVRGQWVELRQEDIQSALKLLSSYKEAGGIPVADAIELATAGVVKGSVEVKITDADSWMKEVMQQLTSKASPSEMPTPAGFSGILRPYQVRGFSWLAFMRKLGLGACLADDMGLGKTIQFIALTLHNRASRGSFEGSGQDSENYKTIGRSKVLLVCPTSIVGNWRREADRFAPSLRTLIHHGINRLRGSAFTEAVKAHDIVITSYSLMTRDAETLASVEWDTIALDEAQNVKNHWTKQAHAARKLKAFHRVALTGTPIENRLSELWSIMDFLNPGYLGSIREFRQSYAIPIERYGDDQRQERLRRLAQPFILRRLKTDPDVISDLPEKIEAKVFCNLTNEQASLYDAYVKEVLSKIESSEGMQRRGLVLAALTRLKQICDHPSLFLADNSNNLEGRSGKMERLREMLEEVVSIGERSLVFTQYAEMGEMLRRHLQASLGCEAFFLHGGVPRKARDEMVRQFQTDSGNSPPIFILSLRAGGLGLNLTRASHVFHFDRWWNPAVENQATDRAHRIGQTRNVQVYKLISGGTLEDRIDVMIDRKKGLAKNILSTGEAWLTELSTEELRDVFTLRCEDGADQ